MSASSGICRQFAANGICTYGGRCKFQHVLAIQTAASSSSRNTPRTRTRRKSRAKCNPGKGSKFASFFEKYPPFEYNPTNSIVSEFYRMCGFFDWDWDDPDREDAHQAFKDAMVQEFNDIYGTDENDIDSWHHLCLVLNIEPVPQNLKDCRDAVLATHVNIVDLVDHCGQNVIVFPSLDALRIYTKANGKYFPRENAYAGGLLKFLLRELNGTYHGDRKRRSGQRRQRRR